MKATNIKESQPHLLQLPHKTHQPILLPTSQNCHCGILSTTGRGLEFNTAITTSKQYTAPTLSSPLTPLHQNDCLCHRRGILVRCGCASPPFPIQPTAPPCGPANTSLCEPRYEGFSAFCLSQKQCSAFHLVWSTACQKACVSLSYRDAQNPSAPAFQSLC
jgi:hypothetical protein